MQGLKNYQEDLAAKATKVTEIAEKYPDTANNLNKFQEINNTKVKTTMPEIMVYGIYNAGKSSILNELMGEDRATVNDVPETDKVTYYEWQGYKIADTPGIFAPIEHEDVTEEHLKKADIVLFVMSTTGSNEKLENYQRMKTIADAGKKIIIVLNDKNGDMGKNDEAITLIKQKVAINMQKIGIENVDEKYCIVTVNAKRAKLGRLKNKPELIAMSAMTELKEVILTELKHTSSFEILRNAIREIENSLNAIIKIVEGQENSALIKKMNEVLEAFNQQKMSIRSQINRFIDMRAEMLASTLPQTIWSNRSNTDKLNEIVSEEIEKFSQRVQEEMQNQLKETAAILQMELESFSEIKLNAQSPDAESFKNILDNLTKVNENLSNEVTATVDKGNNKNSVTNLAALNITANLVSESAKTIAKNLAKTTIGKALASTTIGKAAGALIPVIGPIITIVSVLSTLSDLFGNDDQKKLEAQIAAQNEQERKRVEAEKQARQELNQKCFYLADKLATELKNSVDNSIKEVLDKYEEPFKMEIANRKAEGQKVADDVNKLREVYNEYDLLRAELTTSITAGH